MQAIIERCCGLDVHQDGFVFDILVQSRRDNRAAKRLLRKLLKRQCWAPRVLIADKLVYRPRFLGHRIEAYAA